MNESIFTAVKILGMLFFLCKFINLAARLSGNDEVRSVMGNSLSIRTGIFSAK
jgi:hypothetical protein